MSQNDQHRHTYYLGPEIIARIKKLAESLGHTESGFMRYFLNRKLPEEERRVYGDNSDGR